MVHGMKILENGYNCFDLCFNVASADFYELEIRTSSNVFSFVLE